jgi:hypothetical protein
VATCYVLVSYASLCLCVTEIIYHYSLSLRLKGIL